LPIALLGAVLPTVTRLAKVPLFFNIFNSFLNSSLTLLSEIALLVNCNTLEFNNLKSGVLKIAAIFLTPLI